MKRKRETCGALNEQLSKCTTAMTRQSSGFPARSPKKDTPSRNTGCQIAAMQKWHSVGLSTSQEVLPDLKERLGHLVTTEPHFESRDVSWDDDGFPTSGMAPSQPSTPRLPCLDSAFGMPCTATQSTATSSAKKRRIHETSQSTIRLVNYTISSASSSEDEYASRGIPMARARTVTNNDHLPYPGCHPWPYSNVFQAPSTRMNSEFLDPLLAASKTNKSFCTSSPNTSKNALFCSSSSLNISTSFLDSSSGTSAKDESVPSLRKYWTTPSKQSFSLSLSSSSNGEIPRRPPDISPGFFDVSPLPRFLGRKQYGVPDYDLDDFKLVENLSFIDTHCHLDFLFKRHDFKGTYSSFRAVNQDTFSKSYEGCVAVFCDPLTFNKVSMWDPILKEKSVWACFGCHPHMAAEYNDQVETHLVQALKHEKVVALGEIGLDYSHKNSCQREIQKSVFRRQLKLATTLKLPVVIHSRDSTEDTLALMKEFLPRNHRIHRHCFTGTWKEACQWLHEFTNLYIGLTGLVTYSTAKELHEVARMIPLNRLLLETDAPYFLPRKVDRIKRWSHPGMAIHVAAQIAAFRDTETLENILIETRRNTWQMYGV